MLVKSRKDKPMKAKRQEKSEVIRQLLALSEQEDSISKLPASEQTPRKPARIRQVPPGNRKPPQVPLRPLRSFFATFAVKMFNRKVRKASIGLDSLYINFC